MAQEIAADQWESLVETANGTVVALWGAPWCPACERMRPVVERVAKGQPGVEASFYYVNVDDALELAEKLGISAVPALLRYENGKQTAKSVGFVDEAAVRAFVAAS